MKTLLALLLLIPSLSWGEVVLFCYTTGGYDYEKSERIEPNILKNKEDLILKINTKKEVPIKYCPSISECLTFEDMPNVEGDCDATLNYTKEFIEEIAVCNEANLKWIDVINRYTLEWSSKRIQIDNDKVLVRQTHQCVKEEPKI